MKKKKGGKGLSVLTGKDLYAYKKELFETEDDADAVAVLANNAQDADLFLEAGNDDLDDLLEDDEEEN